MDGLGGGVTGCWADTGGRVELGSRARLGVRRRTAEGPSAGLRRRGRRDRAVSASGRQAVECTSGHQLPHTTSQRGTRVSNEGDC